MKAWSLFHPFVLMDTQGAPDPVVNQALCLAAREFCERTRAWVEWQDPVPPTPASNQYDFEVPSTQELVRVMRAVVGSRDLKVLSGSDVPPNWQDFNASSFCNTLVHLDATSYLVYPNTEAVRLQLALKPSLTAQNCGDILFDRYAEAIASGAKARLMMTPTAEYFNSTLAAIHKGLFNQAAHVAGNDGFAKRSPDARRVKPAGWLP